MFLLALFAAMSAQAQPSPAASDDCVVAVARDFNGLVPLLAERQRFQRNEREELAALAGRLNALRGRITEALDVPSPSPSAAANRCAALARDLAAERDTLRLLSPTPVPIASPAEPVSVPLTPAVKASGRAAESPAAVPPRAAVKRTVAPAAPPSSPAPRVDPQLDACKAQLRQTHADAEQQLQMAARSGRIGPQQLPEMQRAQSRLAGLTDAVKRSYETVGECEQLGQVLAQEVGRVRALAR